MIARVVRRLGLLALAAAACGRVGFDASDGGSTGEMADAMPDAIVVTPLGRAKAIGVGSQSTVCAVLDDGTLWCWGEARYGALPITSGTAFTLPVQIGTDTDWRRVEVGGRHGCGIRESGTLWCWGFNQFGEVGNGSMVPVTQPVQIGAATDWDDVSLGFRSSCAITTSGIVSCWGDNSAGQLGDNSVMGRTTPQVVPALPPMRQVSAGDLHTCALDANEVLRCWGYNVTGCIGDGTTTMALVPRVIAGNWRRVDANVENTAGIRADGTLWAWGNGQTNVPRQYDARTDWQEVRATLYGACAIRANGDLWCGGGGYHGITGPRLDNNGTLTHREPGARFDTLGLTIDVGCANRDGELQCIGSGNAGQLGDIAGRFDRNPHRIAGIWSAVNAAAFTTCAVDTESLLWCWGTTYYQASNRPQIPTRLDVPAVGAVAAVSVGGIAVTTIGTLWHWGEYVTDAGMSMFAVPPAELDASAWAPTASVGGDSKAAIRIDGSLYTWGRNTNGTIGDGTTTTRGAPTLIGAGYRAVSMGLIHSCAIRSDNTLWCWGSNNSGQIGNGTTNTSLSPTASAVGEWRRVEAGFGGTFAIRSDATLWSWGSNAQGRLGLGAISGTATPLQVGSATWRAIDSTWSASCGIRMDQTLWCWGENSQGQVTGTPGPNLTTPQQLGADADWDEVALGEIHACARKLDGSVWCWGSNFWGERGDGLAWRASYGPVARP